MGFDTERFISEIQTRPCLWNISIEDYNDRTLKEKSWNEVAGILYEGWPNLEEKQKTKKLKDLHKKWKGLRDYFNREKNKNLSQTKTSNANKRQKKRKTPFLNKLQFLRGIKPVPCKHIGLHCRKITETDDSKSTEIDIESLFLQSQTNLPLTIVSDKLFKLIDGKKEEDPDINFFLNILPEVRSMTEKQNLNFRYEVMNLIKKIKYGETEHNSVPEPSYTHRVPEQFNYGYMTAINPHKISLRPEPYHQESRDVYSPVMDLDFSPLLSESIVASLDDIESLLQYSPDNSVSD